MNSVMTMPRAVTAAPVLDQVRHALAEAATQGRPPPGRPTLAAQLGVTQHQVRTALERLAHQSAPAPTPARPALSEPTAFQPTQRRQASTVESEPPDGDTSSPVSDQPVTRAPRRWPLIIIGLGAAVAVWSGWVGLGELTGFGVVRLLPGLWDNLHVNSAVVLPLSVEAYAAYALRIWLGDHRSERARTFARRSSVASLVIGAAAQAGYHYMAAAHITTAPWPVIVLVACVPVLVLGLASALARLVANDATSVATSR